MHHTTRQERGKLPIRLHKMIFQFLTVAALMHLVAASTGCDDVISHDQCQALDCTAFPDLALSFCPNTCQLCHIQTNSSTVSLPADCQDHMSYTQCHTLDCQKFSGLAQQYCQRTCGLCPHSQCVDKEDCTRFGPTICTKFLDLAKRACPLYCNLCVSDIRTRRQNDAHIQVGSIRASRFVLDQLPNTTVSPVSHDDQNGECVNSGGSTRCLFVDCDRFPYEASVYCEKKCGVCRSCDDESPNCSNYGPEVCTKNREWSAFNCANYCQFCDVCKDNDNDCSQFKHEWCISFPDLAKMECTRTCKMCELSYHPWKFLNITVGSPLSMQTPLLPVLTTTTKATTQTIPTTQATLQTHVCNKFGLIYDVAEHVTVTNSGAGLCMSVSSSNSQSEAVILEHCSAPNVTDWRQGDKVVDHCGQIPRYTPIATFTFGKFVQSGNSMSAVFINCEPNGFKAILQICGHAVGIVHMTTDSPSKIENAINYYIINW